MAVPTVLPTEATPLDFGHKRKHAEVVDLTEDDDNEDNVATSIQQSGAKIGDDTKQEESQQTQTTTTESQQIDQDEDEFLEDMLEELEDAHPFIDGTVHVRLYHPRHQLTCDIRRHLWPDQRAQVSSARSTTRSRSGEIHQGYTGQPEHVYAPARIGF